MILRNKKGFSLIEVMLLFVVLSVIMAASIPAISRRSTTPYNAKHGTYICYPVGNGNYMNEYYSTFSKKSETSKNECKFNPPQNATMFQIDLYGAGAGGVSKAIIKSQPGVAVSGAFRLEASGSNRAGLTFSSNNVSLRKELYPTSEDLINAFAGLDVIRTQRAFNGGDGGDAIWESPQKISAATFFRNRSADVDNNDGPGYLLNLIKIQCFDSSNSSYAPDSDFCKTLNGVDENQVNNEIAYFQNGYDAKTFDLTSNDKWYDYNHAGYWPNENATKKPRDFYHNYIEYYAQDGMNVLRAKNMPYYTTIPVSNIGVVKDVANASNSDIEGIVNPLCATSTCYQDTKDKIMNYVKTKVFPALAYIDNYQIDRGVYTNSIFEWRGSQGQELRTKGTKGGKGYHTQLRYRLIDPRLTSNFSGVDPLRYFLLEINGIRLNEDEKKVFGRDLNVKFKKFKETAYDKYLVNIYQENKLFTDSQTKHGEKGQNGLVAYTSSTDPDINGLLLAESTGKYWTVAKGENGADVAGTVKAGLRNPNNGVTSVETSVQNTSATGGEGGRLCILGGNYIVNSWPFPVFEVRRGYDAWGQGTNGADAEYGEKIQFPNTTPRGHSHKNFVFSVTKFTGSKDSIVKQVPEMDISGKLYKKLYSVGQAGTPGTHNTFYKNNLGKSCTITIPNGGEKILAKDLTEQGLKNRAESIEKHLNATMTCKDNNGVVFEGIAEGGKYNTAMTAFQEGTHEYNNSSLLVDELYDRYKINSDSAASIKYPDIKRFWKHINTDFASLGISAGGSGTSITDSCTASKGNYSRIVNYVKYLIDNESLYDSATDEIGIGTRKEIEELADRSIKNKVLNGMLQGQNCYPGLSENDYTSTKEATFDETNAPFQTDISGASDGGRGAVMITW